MGGGSREEGGKAFRVMWRKFCGTKQCERIRQKRGLIHHNLYKI